MPFRRRKRVRRTRLIKRLAIAATAVAAAFALFYFYPARSHQPEKQPHKITLRWNNAAHAKSYIVYRRPDRVATYLKLGRTVEPSYEDRAVEAGQRYCYHIITVDSHGSESPPSAELCVDVPQP